MAEEKILERVQKLLALAEHEATSQEERDAALSMADKLMVKHAIDEAMLASTQSKEERRKPVSEEITLFDMNSPHTARFRTIMAEIARTCRVRCALRYNGQATLVGFSDDVAYSQMLFHSIHFAFLAALQPTWETSREFDDNVYRLKEAGIKWVSIANAANRAGEEVPWPDGGRLIRAYKRQCKRLKVEPTAHTQRHDAYRESYAEAFTQRICERLEAMRAAARGEAESSGAEVALRDRNADVDDLFWEMFPNLRPMDDETRARLEAEDRERRRLEQEKHDAWWSSLTEKQKATHLEKKERERRRNMAANHRYWREQDKKYDSMGARRGAKAADTVDLVRKDGVGTSTKGQIQ